VTAQTRRLVVATRCSLVAALRAVPHAMVSHRPCSITPGGLRPMSTEPEEEDQVCRLIRQFTTHTIEGRFLAAHALAALGPQAQPAVPALIEGLHHADVALRVSAAHALASIGRPAVVPLIAALQEEDIDFRQAVIVTLGQIGPPARAAVPVLTVALEDEHL